MSEFGNFLRSLDQAWREPQYGVRRGRQTTTKMRCRFAASGITDHSDLQKLTPPASLVEFWRAAESAYLFEDAEYGQWGLHVLSPAESSTATAREVRSRPSDMRPGDLVVGEFLGDADLLLVRCDDTEADVGCVLVVRPIDGRQLWDKVGSSFGEFIRHFCETQGDKFWELRD